MDVFANVLTTPFCSPFCSSQLCGARLLHIIQTESSISNVVRRLDAVSMKN